MSDTRDPLEAYIDMAAQALHLPLDAAWKPAVTTNLKVTLDHGKLVESFALPDDAEPAPVFRA